MIVTHEDKVEGDHIGAPYKRVIRHLATPETLGTKNLWIGTTTIDVGSKSNAHSHDVNEEVFYCVSGKGIIKVDDEEHEWTPGTVVFSPPGTVHQIINTGDVPLKYVCCVSPPFGHEQFRSDHEMES